MRKISFLKFVIGASLICIVGLCCRTCLTRENGQTSSESQPAGEKPQPQEPREVVGITKGDTPRGPVEIIYVAGPVPEALKQLRKNPDSRRWFNALKNARPSVKDIDLLIKELGNVRFALTHIIMRLLEKSADKMTQQQIEKMWETVKTLVKKFVESEELKFKDFFIDRLCPDLMKSAVETIFAGEVDARFKEQVLEDLVKLGEKGQKYRFALKHLHRFGASGLKAALALLQEIQPEEDEGPGPNRIFELRRQIWQIRDPEAIPTLMETLEKEKDPDLVSAAARALSAMDVREAIPIFNEMLEKKESPDFVRTASRALLALGEELEPKPYINMLKSRDENARKVGLSVLGMLREPGTVQPVIQLFEKLLVGHNRMAERFGKSGAELYNPDFVSEADRCFDSLGRIGTMEAVEYLMSVFRNQDVYSWVRGYALDAIEKRCPDENLKKELIPELKSMVDDRSLSKGTRAHAADFIYEVTKDEAYEFKSLDITKERD